MNTDELTRQYIKIEQYKNREKELLQMLQKQKQQSETALQEQRNACRAAESMVKTLRQHYEPIENHYNAIIRSRGWRFLNYLYKLRTSILPIHSRRYKLVKAVLKPLLTLYRKVKYRKAAQTNVEQMFAMFKNCSRVDIVTVPHTMYIAKLLQGILKDAGIDAAIHTSEPEQYEDIPYIFICAQMFKRFPPVYVAFQMEQTVNSRWLTDEYMNILHNAYAVFDYSLENIKYFSSDPKLASKLYYLPVDSCQEMRCNDYDSDEREYDVLFYGDARNDRRQKYLKEIGDKFNLRIVSEVFGPELYKEMNKAKIIVNIHYYENALLETTRLYETLSVSDCLIISERSCDSTEEVALEDIVDFVEIDNVDAMIERIQYWLNHEDERKAKVVQSIETLEKRSNAAKFYLYRFLLANDRITFDEFYNAVGSYIHFETDRVCLSLPESVVRAADFTKDNAYGFKFFPGLKHRFGWVGCGMSYKFMLRKAMEQQMERILICEDDVYFPPDFEERFLKVLNYANSHDDWNVFSGIMADLGRVTPLKYAEENGEEYIYLNRMISMVFNLYDKSIFEAISDWDNMNRDVERNTIDRYLENRKMRVLTTCPFLVGHKEDLQSTIWGQQNSIYTSLIEISSIKLREIVEKFKTNQV